MPKQKGIKKRLS